MDKTRELLVKEIEKEIENLKNLEPGSEEHTKAVESLNKLYKLKTDEDFRTIENDIKRYETNSNKYAQYAKIGVEIAGVVLPLVFYASWMKKGFKFEETGTFTSTTFRGLFQKFKTTN